MEKHEKIQANQQRTMRWMQGSILFIVCLILIWGMEEPEEAKSLIRQAIPPERLREIQQFIHNEPPPVVVKQVTTQTDPNGNDQEEETAEKEEETAEKEEDDNDDDNEKALVQRVKDLDQEVRKIKAQLPRGVHMEVDETALAATRKLQDATRLLLKQRYGPKEPYRVKVWLKFQESNPTFATLGERDVFVMEMAPARLQPHSVFTFLEVARKWNLPGKGGAFHRRANHVLQVQVKGNPMPHLAFQEYNPDWPHQKGTVGYAGRPSGPAWYVSIQDNTKNHGPGSQQHENPYEADSCFGKVVEGFENVVLQRITKMPGSGFLPQSAHVLIERMTILVPSSDQSGSSFVEWKPKPSLVEFS